MADEYKITSTSKVTAVVEDRELSSTTTTRRIIRSELVNNPNNAEACVKIAVLHQRKKKDGDWEDIEGKSLSTLKAGEMAKLTLDSAETLRLMQELQNLFAIHQHKGVPKGERKVVIGFDTEVIKADPERAKVITALLEQGYSLEVWEELVEYQPDLATKLALIRLHQKRSEALGEFEQALENKAQGEAFWQDFFERNTWIFGYGLNYKILKTVQNQPNYGGTSVTGAGGQRGDFLAATSGDLRFTVLVEVKKPTSSLLGQEYRNSVYPAGGELSGGISQLQVNCRKWETEGSRTDDNRERLDDVGVATVQPKGILVIGQSGQLDSPAKRNSFELLRRNIGNPEIITFDELLERARFIVDHIKPEPSGANAV